MVAALDRLPLSGTVVIGRPDQEHPLAAGRQVGYGGRAYELAVDPVEGGPVLARGQAGALSILAAAAPGVLTPLPRMYMKKMAVGPVARGRIDLRKDVAENLQSIADAFGRTVADVTAIVLDRPRHDDLVSEIREAGARIKLIADGDITATIDAAIRGTNDHLAIGIGGAHAGRHLGRRAALPGRRDPGPAVADEPHRDQPGGRVRHRRHQRIFGTDDLVRGDVIVVASGHLERRPAARRALRRRRRAHAVDRPLLALQPRAVRRLDPPLLARAARRDPPLVPEAGVTSFR